MVRIRTWWQATVVGLLLGGVIGALYGALLSVTPGLGGRLWYLALSTGDVTLLGAALGVCYGGVAGLAGAIALAVDARLARDPAARSGLAVRVAAAVAAAIGVVVAFLLVALVAELVNKSVSLSDLSLLVLVVVPAAVASAVAAFVAQFCFRPVLSRSVGRPDEVVSSRAS